MNHYSGSSGPFGQGGRGNNSNNYILQNSNYYDQGPSSVPGPSSAKSRNGGSPWDQQQQHQSLYNPHENVDPNDRQAILNHPLLPLLVRIWKKCELAANSSKDPNGLHRNEDCSNKSVYEDIAQFARQIQQENPYYKLDPSVEVDAMMIDAIRVFRLHLLELEKLEELSGNFAKNYISMFKHIMPSDLIAESNDDKSSEQENESTNYQLLDQDSVGYDLKHEVPSPAPRSGRSQSHTSSRHSQQSYHSMDMDNPQPDPRKAKHLAGPPMDFQQFSQSNWNSNSPYSTASNYSPAPDSNPESLGSGDGEMDQCDEDDVFSNGKKGQKKRGVFPKKATEILRNWLFQNLTHPYPTEDKKRELAVETGLTILQVNNWFINARRRIVQPLLDQSNRAAQRMNVGMFPSPGQTYSGHSMDMGLPSPPPPPYYAHAATMNAAGPNNYNSFNNPYAQNLPHGYGYAYGMQMSQPNNHQSERHHY